MVCLCHTLLETEGLKTTGSIECNIVMNSLYDTKLFKKAMEIPTRTHLPKSARKWQWRMGPIAFYNKI